MTIRHPQPPPRELTPQELKLQDSVTLLSKTPLYLCGVAAGFPSPADDYIDKSLDFNDYLVKKPAATFIARANGSSMIRLGIFDRDLLVVDRSIEAAHGDIVIAALEGELVCKVLDTRQRRLLSANPEHKPISIREGMELLIEGVVTFSIRHHHVCTR